MVSEQENKEGGDKQHEESNNAELSSSENNSQADNPRDSDFIPKDVLEQLPPEVRKVVAMQVSSIAGPRPNPIVSKLNEKHIDTILELAGKDDERSHEDVKTARLYNLIYAVLGVGVFIFVTYFLAQSNTELYQEVLKLFAIFAGGFGGGFGVKAYIDRKKY